MAVSLLWFTVTQGAGGVTSWFLNSALFTLFLTDPFFIIHTLHSSRKPPQWKMAVS